MNDLIHLQPYQQLAKMATQSFVHTLWHWFFIVTKKKKKNVDVGFNRFFTEEPNLFADNSKILGDS